MSIQVNVSILIVSRFVALNVSWTILIVMSSSALMICLMIILAIVVASMMVSMVIIMINCLKIVVSMSIKVIYNNTMMVIVVGIFMDNGMSIVVNNGVCIVVNNGVCIVMGNGMCIVVNNGMCIMMGNGVCIVMGNGVCIVVVLFFHQMFQVGLVVLAMLTMLTVVWIMMFTIEVIKYVIVAHTMMPEFFVAHIMMPEFFVVRIIIAIMMWVISSPMRNVFIIKTIIVVSIEHIVVVGIIWCMMTAMSVVSVMTLISIEFVIITMFELIMMISTYIVMLVACARMLSMRVMVVGWLTFHWCEVSFMVVLSMVFIIIVRLHLKDQVSFLNIGLRSSESCAVSIKSSVVTLVPSIGVECIEIILPIEVKSTCLVVVCVGLNIVIEQIPWHVPSVKTFSPRLKSWRPEVHHKRLRLVHVPYSWIRTLNSAHFLVVETPRNIMWCPFHLVNVPFVLGVEITVIIM